MRVLLASLNSKYVHSNLALKYLYAAAASSPASIEIKEFTINNNDSYVFTEILAGAYDVICFSCYVWNIEATAYLAENLKKANPDAVIVFGGPETSYDTVRFMQRNKAVDFVVIGEGEQPFARLLDALASEDTRYEAIAGLAYRSGNHILVNPVAEPLAFESVLFPYPMVAWEHDRIMYYQSSRGCPFHCAYCMSSLEKTLRALPIERVFQDIGYFLGNHVKQVKFVDRTFNWDNARCREILQYMIDKDNGVTNFHFEICGELIDDAFVDLISTARKGLFQFEIGIQSTNKQTLAAVNRSVAIENVLQNAAKVTALDNVYIHIDLIAGLPFEDYDTFKQSFNDAYGLSADTLQLGFLKLLKGTEIREKAAEYRYTYRRKAPYEMISNMFLSAQDVCRLKQIEEVLDLYHNRDGFAKTLQYATKALAQTPFDFYEEFSIFFHLKGFQHRAHKKEDLYRILYAYAVWKTKKLEISSEPILSMLVEDMGESLNPDAIKKFERKGWEI
ncbi:MAG: B12-binding domain-containing radical SAM protein [Clostridiales bacterium]|nr:B12-binding domain-containing radical SAM protein [Clostridiales bacterium]